jgi:hypothetical protein
MRLVQKPTDVRQGPVIAEDTPIVGYIVAIVSEWRRKERKEPDAVDS